MLPPRKKGEKEKGFTRAEQESTGFTGQGGKLAAVPRAGECDRRQSTVSTFHRLARCIADPPGLWDSVPDFE